MAVAVPILALTGYFISRFFIVWGLVLSLFLVLRISHPIPIPRPAASPLWVLGLLDLLASYGLTVILAVVLTGIWQLAMKP
jgi:hypothetical protein